MKYQNAHDCHCAAAQKLTRLPIKEWRWGRDLKTLKLQRLSGLISLHRCVLNHLQMNQRQGRNRSNLIGHDSSATVWPHPTSRKGLWSYMEYRMKRDV